MGSRERSARAHLALVGLSIGDAFGEQFFGPPEVVATRLSTRELPGGTWRWTDDTAMAVDIVGVLDERGRVDQDRLADLFAARYLRDPARGYGGGAHQVLGEIARGVPWRVAGRALFGGEGSHGNGAAMRVPPLGGYFADDLRRCAAEAARSAEVTHAHPEAAAGAVAVAVAAAHAATRGPDGATTLMDAVLAHTPAGQVRRGVEAAAGLGARSGAEAAAALGSGQGVSAADTVPFVLWCAQRWLGDLSQALWGTVEGLGDRDTTCAMVGGIVALAVGHEGIPDELTRAREPLPVR